MLTNLRQFRQDATDRQLERDIDTILSEIIRFPTVLNYEVKDRVITGVARSGNERYKFKLDYSGAEPEFTTDLENKGV